MHSHRKKLGFTLVELSVVLVIIGLLVGGVLGGQSLIRASELRSVSTQYSQFTTAIYAFHDRYNAIPGDMPNASDMWGKRSDCGGSSTALTATCDGNGNGFYDLMCGQPSPMPESFLGWQHLALAGLIEGNYSGQYAVNSGNPCTGVAVPGVNVPKGKLNPSGWVLQSYSQSGCCNFEAGAYMDLPNLYYNWIIFGAAAGALTTISILTPAELWNIDTKMDDGLPGQGIIRAGNIYTGCPTTANAASAQYNVGNSGKICWMVVKLDFN